MLHEPKRTSVLNIAVNALEYETERPLTQGRAVRTVRSPLTHRQVLRQLKEAVNRVTQAADDRQTTLAAPDGVVPAFVRFHPPQCTRNCRDQIPAKGAGFPDLLLGDSKRFKMFPVAIVIALLFDNRHVADRLRNELIIAIV